MSGCNYPYITVYPIVIDLPNSIGLPNLNVPVLTSIVIPDWNLSKIVPAHWDERQVFAPTIVKPLITWADVYLDGISIVSSQVPEYSKVPLVFPNIEIPEAVIVPSVQDISYFYPEFKEFMCGVVPINVSVSDPIHFRQSLPPIFDFIVDTSIFDKELKLVDLDVDSFLRRLRIFGASNFGRMRLDFFQRVGVDESSFLRKERGLFLDLYERVRAFLQQEYTLKSLLQDNEFFGLLEKMFGERFFVAKERELIKYSILVDVYRTKVKLLSEWFNKFLLQVKDDFIFEYENYRKSLFEWGLNAFLKEVEVERRKREVSFEIEKVRSVLGVNDVLFDLYQLTGRALMLQVSLEVLNVERDILINEMLITKQEYEVVNTSQDVLSVQKELLEKRWEVLQERAQLLNFYKDSLVKELDILKQSFEAKWNEVLTRYVKLEGEADIANLRSQYLDVDVEVKGLNTFYSFYREYLQEYLRFQMGYWKSFYDIRKQVADLKSTMLREAINFDNAVIKRSFYTLPMLNAIFLREQYDWQAVQMMSKAQITANIIEELKE